MEKFIGQVSKIIFEADNQEEPKYRIGILKLNKNYNSKNTISIKGNWDLILHHEYEIYGSILTDSNYGNYLQFSYAKIKKPDSEKELVKFFSSDNFENIGVRKAKKIINYYDKTNVIQKIIQNYESLKKIEILTAKNISNIKNYFQEKFKYEELYILFEKNDLELSILNKIIKLKLKVSTLFNLIQEDPYKLWSLTNTIKFEQADSLFLKFHSNSKYSSIRIIYYMEYLCWEYTNQTGSTIMDINQLYKQLKKYFQFINNDDFQQLLLKSFNSKSLYYDKKQSIVMPWVWYLSEKNAADLLLKYKNLNKKNNIFKKLNISQFKSKYNSNLILDDSQVSAIESICNNPITIITGGPGTGKTTLISTFTQMIKTTYPDLKIILAAPTGIAARRLSKQAHHTAKTIHSLVLWDMRKTLLEFAIEDRSKIKTLEANILIIDETSMVDIWMLSELLKICRKVKRIIFLGDPYQLPSIKGGHVLLDLINSKLFSISNLQHIYRQGNNNDIVNLSSMIWNSDKTKNLNFDKSLFFFNVQDKDQILNKIQSEYRKVQKLSYDKLQLLCPMYKPKVGINNLNKILQEQFNYQNMKKNSPNVKNLFYLNDKVMQLNNDTNKDISNGDIGIIIKINSKQSKNENKLPLLIVDFSGRKVHYEASEIYELTLAYAVSIHKSQGCEFDNVFLVLHKDHQRMLNKNLIYTAITRAKKKLYIIGSKSLFFEAIQVDAPKRYTNLLNFLKNKKH